MALILKKHIKDQILVVTPDQEDREYFPSPEDLKYKFLIKGKGVLDFKNFDQFEDVDFLSTNIESKGITISNSKIYRATQKISESDPNFNSRQPLSIANQNPTGDSPSKKMNLQIDTDQANSTYNQSYDNRAIILTDPDSPKEHHKPGKDHLTPEKKLKVDSLMNRLYCLVGCKFGSKSKRTVWHSISLSEGAIIKHMKHDYNALIEMHKRYFTRVYPSGIRVDSSNYDPIPAWNVGAQLVALNFQTLDEPMLLNYAKFMANGGIHSGYKLKPNSFLHDTDPSKTVLPIHLRSPKKLVKVNIISGQQLKPGHSTRDVIDPVVEIRLRGMEIDELNNPPKKTSTVKDNGFHPIWTAKQNNCFEFKICAPELATLIFLVHNDEVLNKERIGWFAIEFEHMRSGYRTIPILNHDLNYISFSYIFCHIKISDI